MKPLVDGDILRYEIGFSSQIVDEDTGKPVVLDFDHCAELLDRKIELICEEVGATEPPTLYLTGDKYTLAQENRHRKFMGLAPKELVPNFREAIAVTKPYKGTRKTEKPFHFNNLTIYLMSQYDCHISYGLEADDSMSIYQVQEIDKLNLVECSPKNLTTIICSRDKDLRMTPGWHYSWECGAQASLGPTHTNNKGWLEERDNGKVLGYGEMFFYYQMLVGDAVDNIPGVPRVGPKKALPLLQHSKTSREAYEIVRGEYQRVFGDDWLPNLQEQANLLWMVRELDERGEPILFRPPKD